MVGGHICLKPGRAIPDEAVITLSGQVSQHRVGRGYDKLREFLEVHSIDFEGRNVVDGGASTGGFTQLALELGASSVAAVEIGSGQLAKELAIDPRVLDMPGTDLLTLTELPWPCDILLLDLSCMNLLSALPAIKLPFASESLLIALVKPQYIHGPGKVGARADHLAKSAVRDCLADVGWKIMAERPVSQGPEQVDSELFILAQRQQ